MKLVYQKNIQTWVYLVLKVFDRIDKHVHVNSNFNALKRVNGFYRILCKYIIIL